MLAIRRPSSISSRGIASNDDMARGLVELQRDRKLPDRAGLDRREHWGNEFAHRLGIDDREPDLIWLFGQEAAPDRVALRPEILALVVERSAFSLTTMPSETQST